MMRGLKGNMQRLQIGIFGLVSVLLMVGLASLVVNRASDEKTALEEIRAEQGAEGAADAIVADAPKEPLAEIGVAPAPPSDADIVEQGAAAQPQSSAQVVPDLKPDPALKAPMDREP